MNAAALSSLALAPAAPQEVKIRTAKLDHRPTQPAQPPHLNAPPCRSDKLAVRGRTDDLFRDEALGEGHLRAGSAPTMPVASHPERSLDCLLLVFEQCRSKADQRNNANQEQCIAQAGDFMRYLVHESNASKGSVPVLVGLVHKDPLRLRLALSVQRGNAKHAIFGLQEAMKMALTSARVKVVSLVPTVN